MTFWAENIVMLLEISIQLDFTYGEITKFQIARLSLESRKRVITLHSKGKKIIGIDISQYLYECKKVADRI